MFLRACNRYLSNGLKSRSMADSNSSLLEAFSQIIKDGPKPTAGSGNEERNKSGPMLRAANPIIPAHEFNAPEKAIGDGFTDFGGKVPRFRPGDFYMPEDLVVISKDNTLTKQLDPFVVVRRNIDIFRRSKYDMSQMHLNVSFMANCLSPLGKIVGRQKSGLSAKSHRHMAKAIKRARHMGLLPYMQRPTTAKQSQ